MYGSSGAEVIVNYFCPSITLWMVSEETYRVPLKLGDLRNLKEDPLTGSVLETGFDNP